MRVCVQAGYQCVQARLFVCLCACVCVRVRACVRVCPQMYVRAIVAKHFGKKTTASSRADLLHLSDYVIVSAKCIGQ